MEGLYKVLGIPFGFVLNLIYEIIPNYGWAIILLTLFTKFLMIPSSIKQQKSMAKTQRMQAKIRKIQQKYAGDQKKIQEETTALYQRENYNPMNMGCSSMLWQFIILFCIIGAIYYPLSNFLRIDENQIGALVGALKDLKLMPKSSLQGELYVVAHIDAIVEAFNNGKIALKGVSPETLAEIQNIEFRFFGISLGEIPNNYPVFTNIVWIIPVLSLASSLLTGIHSMIKQKRQNPDTQNNAMMMGCMALGMPIMSLIFVVQYPIGVGIYWIASSVFGFISTLIIGHFYSPKKTLAKIMVEETIERRSKEENTKQIAANKK